MEFKLNLLTPTIYSKEGDNNCVDNIVEHFAEYVQHRSSYDEFNFKCKYDKIPGLAFIHNFEDFEERFLIHSEYAIIISSPESQIALNRFIPRLLVFLSMKPIWQSRFIFICLGNVNIMSNLVVNDPITFSLHNWETGDENSWIKLFELLKVTWKPHEEENCSSNALFPCTSSKHEHVDHITNKPSEQRNSEIKNYVEITKLKTRSTQGSVVTVESYNFMGNDTNRTSSVKFTSNETNTDPKLLVDDQKNEYIDDDVEKSSDESEETFECNSDQFESERNDIIEEDDCEIDNSGLIKLQDIKGRNKSKTVIDEGNITKVEQSNEMRVDKMVDNSESFSTTSNNNYGGKLQLLFDKLQRDSSTSGQGIVTVNKDTSLTNSTKIGDTILEIPIKDHALNKIIDETSVNMANEEEREFLSTSRLENNSISQFDKSKDDDEISFKYLTNIEKTEDNINKIDKDLLKLTSLDNSCGKDNDNLGENVTNSRDFISQTRHEGSLNEGVKNTIVPSDKEDLVSNLYKNKENQSQTSKSKTNENYGNISDENLIDKTTIQIDPSLVSGSLDAPISTAALSIVCMPYNIYINNDFCTLYDKTITDSSLTDDSSKNIFLSSRQLSETMDISMSSCFDNGSNTFCDSNIIDEHVTENVKQVSETNLEVVNSEINISGDRNLNKTINVGISRGINDDKVMSYNSSITSKEVRKNIGNIETNNTDNYIKDELVVHTLPSDINISKVTYSMDACVELDREIMHVDNNNNNLVNTEIKKLEISGINDLKITRDGDNSDVLKCLMKIDNTMMEVMEHSEHDIVDIEDKTEGNITKSKLSDNEKEETLLDKNRKRSILKKNSTYTEDNCECSGVIRESGKVTELLSKAECRHRVSFANEEVYEYKDLHNKYNYMSEKNEVNKVVNRFYYYDDNVSQSEDANIEDILDEDKNNEQQEIEENFNSDILDLEECESDEEFEANEIDNLKRKDLDIDPNGFSLKSEELFDKEIEEMTGTFVDEDSKINKLIFTNEKKSENCKLFKDHNNTNYTIIEDKNFISKLSKSVVNDSVNNINTLKLGVEKLQDIENVVQDNLEKLEIYINNNTTSELKDYISDFDVLKHNLSLGLLTRTRMENIEYNENIDADIQYEKVLPSSIRENKINNSNIVNINEGDDLKIGISNVFILQESNHEGNEFLRNEEKNGAASNIIDTRFVDETKININEKINYILDEYKTNTEISILESSDKNTLSEIDSQMEKNITSLSDDDLDTQKVESNSEININPQYIKDNQINSTQSSMKEIGLDLKIRSLENVNKNMETFQKIKESNCITDEGRSLIEGGNTQDTIQDMTFKTKLDTPTTNDKYIDDQNVNYLKLENKNKKDNTVFITSDYNDEEDELVSRVKERNDEISNLIDRQSMSKREINLNEKNNSNLDDLMTNTSENNIASSDRNILNVTDNQIYTSRAIADKIDVMTGINKNELYNKDNLINTTVTDITIKEFNTKHETLENNTNEKKILQKEMENNNNTDMFNIEEENNKLSLVKGGQTQVLFQDITFEPTKHNEYFEKQKVFDSKSENEKKNSKFNKSDNINEEKFVQNKETHDTSLTNEINNIQLRNESERNVNEENRSIINILSSFDINRLNVIDNQMETEITTLTNKVDISSGINKNLESDIDNQIDESVKSITKESFNTKNEILENVNRKEETLQKVKGKTDILNVEVGTNKLSLIEDGDTQTTLQGITLETNISKAVKEKDYHLHSKDEKYLQIDPIIELKLENENEIENKLNQKTKYTISIESDNIHEKEEVVRNEEINRDSSFTIDTRAVNETERDLFNKNRSILDDSFSNSRINILVPSDNNNTLDMMVNRTTSKDDTFDPDKMDFMITNNKNVQYRKDNQNTKFNSNIEFLESKTLQNNNINTDILNLETGSTELPLIKDGNIQASLQDVSIEYKINSSKDEVNLSKDEIDRRLHEEIELKLVGENKMKTNKNNIVSIKSDYIKEKDEFVRNIRNDSTSNVINIQLINETERSINKESNEENSSILFASNNETRINISGSSDSNILNVINNQLNSDITRSTDDSFYPNKYEPGTEINTISNCRFSVDNQKINQDKTIIEERELNTRETFRNVKYDDRILQTENKYNTTLVDIEKLTTKVSEIEEKYDRDTFPEIPFENKFITPTKNDNQFFQEISQSKIERENKNGNLVLSDIEIESNQYIIKTKESFMKKEERDINKNIETDEKIKVSDGEESVKYKSSFSEISNLGIINKEYYLKRDEDLDRKLLGYQEQEENIEQNETTEQEINILIENEQQKYEENEIGDFITDMDSEVNISEENVPVEEILDIYRFKQSNDQSIDSENNKNMFDSNNGDNNNNNVIDDVRRTEDEMNENHTIKFDGELLELNSNRDNSLRTDYISKSKDSSICDNSKNIPEKLKFNDSTMMSVNNLDRSGVTNEKIFHNSNENDHVVLGVINVHEIQTQDKEQEKKISNDKISRNNSMSKESKDGIENSQIISNDLVNIPDSSSKELLTDSLNENDLSNIHGSHKENNHKTAQQVQNTSDLVIRNPNDGGTQTTSYRIDINLLSKFRSFYHYVRGYVFPTQSLPINPTSGIILLSQRKWFSEFMRYPWSVLLIFVSCTIASPYWVELTKRIIRQSPMVVIDTISSSITHEEVVNRVDRNYAIKFKKIHKNAFGDSRYLNRLKGNINQ